MEDDPTGRLAPSSISEDLLEDPPPTSLQDFRFPKLRKFAHRRLKLGECLGQGAEGAVIKATCDNGDPVAIKIFWETGRPKPQARPSGVPFQPAWPFEDECRTVALLEKIRWATRNANIDPDTTIKLEREPKTFHDAARNLSAFSNERRLSPRHFRNPVPAPPVPGFPTCHGWMKVSRRHIWRADRRHMRGMDETVNWHWAIVYDYVPRAAHDHSIGQAHLDFFYQTGFALESYRVDNWSGGRLLDFGDAHSPFSDGWRQYAYHSRVATTWFDPDWPVYPLEPPDKLQRKASSLPPSPPSLTPYTDEAKAR